MLWHHHHSFPQMNNTTKCSKHVEIAQLGVPWESTKDSDPTAKCCTVTEDTNPNVESMPGANADQAINIWTPQNSKFKVLEPEQSAQVIASNCQ
jgi:hypothetical protein